MANITYDLHKLGWQSFQDLCVAIAEECLKRPVQSFLPSNDAGRDGAFVGRWEADVEQAGSSTIQCKFTSIPNKNLSLSMLDDELDKVSALTEKGLVDDYIIMTNHQITGSSEAKIKAAFEAAGAGRCRTMHAGWIVGQIQKSPRLRMMVPRLYGLGDLGNILDERAYEQAQMILSALGNDLQKLVVTEAHRQSVRAISEHNFVLLLGAPATGKSTIGASLAVGAADIWKSSTIRVTSPQDLKDNINPQGGQFFWVDDAWGATQYQQHMTEDWNKVLPLIQGAIHQGSQFLLTSRDYIWKMAQRDLKRQALPLLEHSRVVINVEELTRKEKAQILYNHVRMGDQSKEFRTAIKPILPSIVASKSFLPETARRLGSTFFTKEIKIENEHVSRFFAEPAAFLLDTIENLSNDCQAAIAFIFLSGGHAASPIVNIEALDLAASSFSATNAQVKSALRALEGSLVILGQEREGSYWAFKHPTVGDAFGQLLAKDIELSEIYVRGAKLELLMREVVCAGVEFDGAPVRVPQHLYPLLIERMRKVTSDELFGFVTYRADAVFARQLLEERSDFLGILRDFFAPVSEDSDAQLLARLHQFELLSSEAREHFVQQVRTNAVDEADSSFLSDSDLRRVLSKEEISSILAEVEEKVIESVGDHVARVKDDWNSAYDPSDHFDQLRESIEMFAEELSLDLRYSPVLAYMEGNIDEAIGELYEDYRPLATVSAPTSNAQPGGAFSELFRDVDE